MEPQQKQNPWLQIINSLRNQIDKNSFETWFEPTAYIGQEEDSIYIKVPNILKTGSLFIIHAL